MVRGRTRAGYIAAGTDPSSYLDARTGTRRQASKQLSRPATYRILLVPAARDGSRPKLTTHTRRRRRLPRALRAPDASPSGARATGLGCPGRGAHKAIRAGRPTPTRALAAFTAATATGGGRRSSWTVRRATATRPEGDRRPLLLPAGVPTAPARARAAGRTCASVVGTTARSGRHAKAVRPCMHGIRPYASVSIVAVVL
jgi:hypothetical protein